MSVIMYSLYLYNNVTGTSAVIKYYLNVNCSLSAVDVG